MNHKIKETYKELSLNFKSTKSDATFVKLYNKMRPGLFNYINRIVKNDNIANDITSTTLTKIYFKIDQYDPNYQITTWAYKMAFNESLGWLKRNKKKISMNAFSDNGIEATNSGYMPNQNGVDLSNIGIYVSTEEKYKDEEDFLETKFRLILESIKSLPSLYKKYMEERFLNHRSYNEILDIMETKESGISLQTVKNRIHKGRKLVKRDLKKSDVFKNSI